jgi:AcrR family transcriptional regulator
MAETALNRKSQQSQDTRERLIEAAAKLFAERGYTNSSVAAIGDAAGVSRGLINHHFGSKENLLYEVIADILGEWNELMVPAVKGTRGMATLRAILDSFMEFADERRERAQLLFRLMAQAFDPKSDMVEEFLKVHARWIDKSRIWWDEGIADGDIDPAIDHESMATFLIGASRGLVLDSLIAPDKADLHKSFEHLWTLFSRGVKPAAA